MSQFFGEFLVARGAIKPEVLVRALLDQMESAPHPAEIAFEARLLNADELLAVLRLQRREALDFFGACAKRGIQVDPIRGEVQRVLRERRKPLGELLVARSALTLADLTRHLDEYLAAFDSPPATMAPVGVAHWPLLETFTPDRLTEIENMTGHLALMTSSEATLFEIMLGDLARRMGAASEALRYVDFKEAAALAARAADVAMARSLPKEVPPTTKLEALAGFFSRTASFLWSLAAEPAPNEAASLTPARRERLAQLLAESEGLA